MAITIRSIREDEIEAWFGAFGAGFYIWHQDPHERAESRRGTIDVDRRMAAFDGSTIVGTFQTFATSLTLPGGGQLTANAVSGVTVKPTHRRQGILTRFNTDDVRRATERGDPVSILMASEWPIYGRFGYGPATWSGQYQLRTRAARFLVEPLGSIELLEPRAARQLLPGIYDRYRVGQPGEISRPDWFWDFDLGLRTLPGRPPFNGLVAIHRDAAGEADGYARFRGEEHWDEGIPDNVAVIEELHGVSEAVDIDLWRFLAQLDLTALLRADSRRSRDPLPWYLADARAARLSNVWEAMWLRILDVSRMLSARSYDRDEELVIEVVDRLAGSAGPASGRYRLEAAPEGATCRRTDRAADLTLPVGALGAALLGGSRLVDATRPGGVTEHRPGALARADALLRTPAEPWCSTGF
jgi:predicted acetyltransferase